MRLVFAALLLFAPLTGCIVEGEECPTTGYTDRKESCLGNDLFTCWCNSFDATGGCIGEVGTWSKSAPPANCTCQQYIGGICAVPVGVLEGGGLNPG
jgi:hypothetical protein